MLVSMIASGDIYLSVSLRVSLQTSVVSSRSIALAMPKSINFKPQVAVERIKRRFGRDVDDAGRLLAEAYAVSFWVFPAQNIDSFDGSNKFAES